MFTRLCVCVCVKGGSSKGVEVNGEREGNGKRVTSRKKPKKEK